MGSPQFQDPMFLDANAPGGLNPAFGTVSGAIAQAGNAVWATGGLVSPETMGYTLSGLTANISLPLPWGLVTSGGVVVNAHGTQTGIDTSAYSVSFASLVPGTGSITAYLAATVISIQQNPVPVPGPPPGHPAYDPTFVPTVAYTVNQLSVMLSAVTGGIDNVNTFELARTTLSAGQTNLTNPLNVQGWERAALQLASPLAPIAAGGTLTVEQANSVLGCSVGGLTSTLPGVGNCGGLYFSFTNPTNGNWTIVTPNSEPILGFGSLTDSVVVPPSGAMVLWANPVASSPGTDGGGAWFVIGGSPNLALAANQASNGHQIIPTPTGDTVIQWGLTTVTSASQVISFDIPFTTQIYQIIASDAGDATVPPSSGIHVCSPVQNGTLTGFTAFASTYPTNFSWVAIGK